MVTVNDTLLDCLCWSTYQRCLGYYNIAGNVMHLMYMSGCRREESVTFSRWQALDINTVQLQPLKGNNPRTFTQEELPTLFWDAVQNQIDPWPSFRISKVNYYIQLKQLQQLLTDDKQLLANSFRHNYAKRLFNQGYTYEQIRVIMGENTLAPVQQYINNPIYSPYSLFTQSSFDTDQAQFSTNTNACSIQNSGEYYMMINYGDYTEPFYQSIAPSSNKIFPEHNYQAPYGAGVDKEWSLFISNTSQITLLFLHSNQFKNTFPASIRQFSQLQHLSISFQSFSDISNTYTESQSIISYSIRSAMAGGQPNSAYALPSQLFTANLLSIQVREVLLINNPVNNNLHLITQSINLTSIYYEYVSFSNSPIDFTYNINLISLRLVNKETVSGQLPASVASLSSLESLNCQYLGLDTYSPIESITSLLSMYFRDDSTIPTDIPSSWSSLTSLYSLRWRENLKTQTRIDDLYFSLYDFIDTNASKVVGNTPFRNMTINTSTGNSDPSGTYQEPTGYVQGSSNGSPASALEMIWVLQNQYLHTVIY